MKEKKSEEKENEPKDFAFEVSSTNSKEEELEAIFQEADVADDLEEEEVKKLSTIKIISERDMEIKEVPPPNYSPYFRCILHFKGKTITKRKLLKNN